MSKDGEGFCLAVFPFEFCLVFHSIRVSPEEQYGSLGEGPFQMSITDLLARGAYNFACRFLCTFYEPAVGYEVLDSGETMNIVDFIEDNEAEDSADAGNRPEAEVDVSFMHLGNKGYLMFNAMEQLIVVVYQSKIKFNTFLYTRVGKPLSDTYTIAFLADILSDLRQVEKATEN